MDARSASVHVIFCRCFIYIFLYVSLWRWKYWSVRQTKPALLAFGRTLI